MEEEVGRWPGTGKPAARAADGVAGCRHTLSRLFLEAQALFSLVPGNQSFPPVADDGLVQLPEVFEVFDALAQAIQFVIDGADGNSLRGPLLRFRREHITHKLLFDPSQHTLKSGCPPAETARGSCRRATGTSFRQRPASLRRRPGCSAMRSASRRFVCAIPSAEPATDPALIRKLPTNTESSPRRGTVGRIRRK